MARQIYVNLPVKDLNRSMAFFAALGFEFDPNFSNDDAVGMIVGENIYVMLLIESFFRTFTKKGVCDARTCTEVLVCLSCDSRAQVDELVARAAAAGGTMARDPQDEGFMYSQAFEDPDGHIWELAYMEPNTPDAG